MNQSAGHSVEQFRAQLASHLETSLNDGRNALASHFASATDQYRNEQNAHQQEWVRGLNDMRGDAAQKFQEHLQSTSDTWVANSMRRLNEHGQNGIETLLRNADQALREAFSKVFEGLAETLRERAVGAAAGATGAVGFAPMPGRDTETSSGPRNEIV